MRSVEDKLKLKKKKTIKLIEHLYGILSTYYRQFPTLRIVIQKLKANVIKIQNIENHSHIGYIRNVNRCTLFSISTIKNTVQTFMPNFSSTGRTDVDCQID